jgi:hypothetical protein
LISFSNEIKLGKIGDGAEVTGRFAWGCGRFGISFHQFLVDLETINVENARNEPRDIRLRESIERFLAKIVKESAMK